VLKYIRLIILLCWSSRKNRDGIVSQSVQNIFSQELVTEFHIKDNLTCDNISSDLTDISDLLQGYVRKQHIEID